MQLMCGTKIRVPAGYRVSRYCTMVEKMHKGGWLMSDNVTKIIKPGRQRVVSVVRSLSHADLQLQSILKTNKATKNVVVQAYNNLQHHAIIKVLENISIDELNRDKSGIRISALKNAGYTNIRQLCGLSLYHLMNISGIGEDGANKIVRRVHELELHAKRLAKVRLQTKDKNSDATQIVVAIAVMMNTRQIVKQADTIYSANHNDLTVNIKSAKKLGSTIRWWFTSKEKKMSRIASLVYLEGIINQGFASEAQSLASSFSTIKGQQNSTTAWTNFEVNNAPFYALLEQIVGTSVISDKTFIGLPEKLVKSVEAFPLDMSLMYATLRDYQVFGAKYLLHQNRTLLGDEMGLGKTIQAIAAMAHLTVQGKNHFIVVAPVSVMINWIREINQHSALEPVKLYGNHRQQVFKNWCKKGGVAVTTYETISRLNIPNYLKIDMLVVDEAHYVKNPDALRTKFLMHFAAHSDNVVFMTGTPLENKVDEMVFLISMLNREVARQTETMKSLVTAPGFRQTIAPVYLRRVRDDVLSELPDKTEKEDWCFLTPCEEKVYKQTLLSRSPMQVRQVSWNVPDIADSSKAVRLLEICKEAEENGRKIIVYSFFLDTIAKIRTMLGAKCFGPISGSVPATRRQEIIDEFSKAKIGSVLVCQIIAGGIGLNIQSASVVVICEPQWKPSSENQAISRVYRMGQSKDVMVHRLLAAETVDERILEILKGKAETFDAFADESVVDSASKTLNESKAMSAIIQSEIKKYG